MDDRPNIILSPHFDDAVLSLGGYIAQTPSRAVVVTVFAGAPADGVAGRWDRSSGFASAADAMRARSRENDEALAVLGVSPDQICNLDHLDGQYRHRAEQAPATNLCSAIVEDVRQMVQRCGGAVNLFAPAFAWHPDHRLVADAALALRDSGGCPATEFFLYQDQPYAYLELRKRSLVPLRFTKFARLSEVALRSGFRFKQDLLGLQQADIQKKRLALQQYKSQFRFTKPLMQKMIDDFSYYQARKAKAGAPYAEMVYRIVPRLPAQS